jgi:tetratricopeptide (TPR) repeat protein
MAHEILHEGSHWSGIRDRCFAIPSCMGGLFIMGTLHRLFFMAAVILISAFLAIAAAKPPQSDKGAEHNKKGLQYYDEAFYQNLPKGKQREADEFFDRAITEFRSAIAADPKSVAAYRNLARVFYVREDYLQAAEAYRRVTLLEPEDVDAHLLLALCYAQIDRFAEALQVLETAKARTDDPEVVEKLDEYVKKINDREQE